MGGRNRIQIWDAIARLPIPTTTPRSVVLAQQHTTDHTGAADDDERGQEGRQAGRETGEGQSGDG